MTWAGAIHGAYPASRFICGTGCKEPAPSKRPVSTSSPLGRPRCRSSFAGRLCRPARGRRLDTIGPHEGVLDTERVGRIEVIESKTASTRVPVLFLSFGSWSKVGSPN